MTPWLQYGALGLLVLAILLGLLWPKPAVDRVIRKLDRCEDEILKKLGELTSEVAELRREVQRLRERDRERGQGP